MFPIIILSGGLGTRLGKISQEEPKCMLDIAGHPFIFHQLKLLESQGIQKVTLCLGHLATQVVEFVETKYHGNLDITFSFDGDSLLGTGGAVKKAVKTMKKPFFVMYGDSYLEISFRSIHDSYLLNKGPLIVIYRNKGLYDTSNVHLSDNRIFYNKKNPHPLSEYIDYGLSIFEKNHFNNIDNHFDLSLIQEKYSKLESLQFFEAKQRFYEIGSFKGIEEIRMIISKNYDKNRKV